MNPQTKLTESDLIDTLQELSLEYRENKEEFTLFACPFCEKGREGKSEHFSFNREALVFNCFKCNTKGNLYTFRREMGLNPWPQDKYVIPDQTKVRSFSNQKDEYYQKYQEKRGVSLETLKKYGVGRTEMAQGETYRTYPYQDLDGIIVNVKYVSADKKMFQEKSAKQIYYGLQFIDFKLPALTICEGEDDCHALVDYGVKNVVSVPGGASSYNEYLHDINNKFSKIYLVFDNDRVGQTGAENFARKAGLYKCWNVILPFKDSRDCLLNKIPKEKIVELFKTATQWDLSTEKCRPALSITERLDRYEKDILNNPTGIKFSYPAFDEITGGLRSGTVTTLLANPGCFKTTTLMNFLIRASIMPDYDAISIFFSFEMQIEAEMEREIQIYYNCKNHELINNITNNKEQWKQQREHLSSSYAQNLYVSEEPYLTIKEMIDVIKKTEAVSNKKCKLIGIDYIDFIKASTGKEYEAVKENMNAIKSYLARGLNTAVIVLCQTNRMGNLTEFEEVGLRSGKGGSGIESASDYLIGIWQDENSNIMARFNKHRRVDSRYLGAPNPYMHLKFNPQTFMLDEICQTENPNKKTKEKEASQSWHDKY